MRCVALVLGWHPQLGNLLAYLVAMATGYVLHSRWSFRGHGASGPTAPTIKFVARLADQLRAQQPVGLAAHRARSSSARPWPILPMLFVTPAVTFVLNRQWVFR